MPTPKNAGDAGDGTMYPHIQRKMMMREACLVLVNHVLKYQACLPKITQKDPLTYGLFPLISSCHVIFHIILCHGIGISRVLGATCHIAWWFQKGSVLFCLESATNDLPAKPCGFSQWSNSPLLGRLLLKLLSHPVLHAFLEAFYILYHLCCSPVS